MSDNKITQAQVDAEIHKKLISKFDTKSTEACGKMGRMICAKNYYQW